MQILFRGTCHFMSNIFFFNFSFWKVLFFFECVKIKNNMKSPCIPVILLHYINEGFLPLYDKFTVFIHSWIRDIHRNAPKSGRYYMNQQFFLQETHFRVQPLSVPRNVCTFDLCSMYSSCPIYWVEHCTAKAVPVRMEILFRGTCRFLFFFIFIVFLTFFLEGSFLFRVCTKIKNNIKCLRIPVFFTSLH